MIPDDVLVARRVQAMQQNIMAPIRVDPMPTTAALANKDPLRLI